MLCGNRYLVGTKRSIFKDTSLHEFYRESNAHAFAFTPHACQNNKYHVCETSGCGGTYSDDRFNGDCDANGCDYNPYRMGNTDFYGKGLTVDTSKKFT